VAFSLRAINEALPDLRISAAAKIVLILKT
jgi:hypothetical protein